MGDYEKSFTSNSVKHNKVSNSVDEETHFLECWSDNQNRFVSVEIKSHYIRYLVKKGNPSISDKEENWNVSSILEVYNK